MRASASVEPQKIEDLAILHRLGFERRACRPRGSAASRRYSACTASSSGRRLHLEQRRFLEPAAADHVEIGNERETLQADRLVEAVDLVGCGAAVGDDAGEPHGVVLRLRLNGRDDAVHGEDRSRNRWR